MAGFTRRFLIVARADMATKANAAAHAADMDPSGGAWFDVPLSASGSLPAQAYWCSAAMTTAMAVAIRTRLQEQGATAGETTLIGKGNTPASNRFAVFDGDLWTPEEVLVACGLKRIVSPP